MDDSFALSSPQYHFKEGKAEEEYIAEAYTYFTLLHTIAINNKITSKKDTNHQ